jgi:hypothetical protein
MCEVADIMAAITGEAFTSGSKNRPLGPVFGDVSYS